MFEDLFLHLSPHWEPCFMLHCVSSQILGNSVCIWGPFGGNRWPLLLDSQKKLNTLPLMQNGVMGGVGFGPKFWADDGATWKTKVPINYYNSDWGGPKYRKFNGNPSNCWLVGFNIIVISTNIKLMVDIWLSDRESPKHWESLMSVMSVCTFCLSI